jgi:hypothetical protein
MTPLLQEKKPRDFYEDFTILRWVKWTTRQPDFNGGVYIRWNGKWTSEGQVFNGILTALEGVKTPRKKVKGQLVYRYTKKQKALLEDMYWLEESHDTIGFNQYRDNCQHAEDFFQAVFTQLKKEPKTDGGWTYWTYKKQRIFGMEKKGATVIFYYSFQAFFKVLRHWGCDGDVIFESLKYAIPLKLAVHPTKIQHTLKF